MSSDESRLAALKIEFANINAQIEQLTQKIAEDNCPYKLDDVITVTVQNKVIQFIVNKIRAVGEFQQLALPKCDSAHPWEISGYRINKTDGTLSKSHTYTVTQNECESINGNTIQLKPQGIEHRLFDDN